MVKWIYFEKRPVRSLNMIWLSVFFSVFYWVMESVRDVLVFNRGDILSRLVMPDPMSFWMRILIVMILLLFGVYAQSLRDRLEKTDLRKPRALRRLGMIYRGLGFGLLYWILEALRDVLVFDKGGLIDRLVRPDPVSVWMRLLAICIMLLFSIYAQNLFEEREKAKQALQKAHDELEDLIRQRTAELSRSYEMLKAENEERRKIEDELIKVNRALKTLSQSNEALVRATEEDALLRNVCRTIVDVGGFPLAWVGLAGPDGALSAGPASSAHQADYDVDLAPLAAAGKGRAVNPAVDVARGGKSRVEPLGRAPGEEAPWTRPALDRGLFSCLFLPLGSGEPKPLGVLAIYSTEENGFDSGETGLLQELADDLAFGIAALRTRAERNRAESEKEKIQAQLLQSQKMEAVGILAGGVAHDFNNLLTAIQVSADLAMMDVGPTNPVHKTLEEIHQVASHAGDLARQLLLFSRKHPMEYAPMSLNASVENLRRMLHRLIGEDIRIQTRLTEGLWNVMADRGTMEQVLMNLAVNARDAMPNGGELLIATENVEFGARDAAGLPEARPGRFVRLTVRDKGVGMQPETLSHIFEPFFSTKGPGKGTGLGLSVVYGIVKQHEGWITVASAPGQGSTFEVFLPSVSEEAAVLQAAGKTPSDRKGKGERILLVEDEKSVGEYTEKALVRSGFRVWSARTAEEAHLIFEREKGVFDVLFTDVVLPDQGGIELAEALRVLKPKLKVLLSSGYTDQKSQWPVIREKGFRFLQKPYALDDLLDALKSVLTAK